MSTVWHNQEYISFGRLADFTCIVLPGEYCSPGGTMLFWAKIPGCVNTQGVLTSVTENAAEGLIMDCVDGTIRYDFFLKVLNYIVSQWQIQNFQNCYNPRG